MLLVIFGAAIFVSCVCCWGDMVAIRRVNAQVKQKHKMLDMLRTRLMQDNYDYETPSVEAAPPEVEAALPVLEVRAHANNIDGESSRNSRHFTRRFAIINNPNSTITPDPADDAKFIAKARETSVTSTRTTHTTTDFIELSTYPLMFSARAADSEGVGYEALFDDIRSLLNQTENNHKSPTMPAESPAQGPGSPVPVPNREGGKLTLKNIEDLEFKFLRVRETGGYNREGDAHSTVTSKDGMFPEIKLPESRRQYMESESGDATDK